MEKLNIDWIELSVDELMAIEFYLYHHKVGNDRMASAMNDIAQNKIDELDVKRVRSVIRDTVNKMNGIELLMAAAALKIPLDGNDPTASALNDIVQERIDKLDVKRVRSVIRDTVNKMNGIELLMAAAALKIPLERFRKK